jgi:hypothetical protein
MPFAILSDYKEQQRNDAEQNWRSTLAPDEINEGWDKWILSVS